MITRDYWKLSHPDAPMAANYSTRAMCEEWRDRKPILGRTPESYLIERVACCSCCGRDQLKPGVMTDSICDYGNGVVRCGDHHGRNPCVIEGCRRTSAAPIDARGFPIHRNDQDFCSEHWRRYVPPGSKLRRAYLRFWRQAKRHGWGYKGPRGRAARLDWRFHRFWDGLVKAARRRSAEGFIDEAEINRIMGWGEGG